MDRRMRTAVSAALATTVAMIVLVVAASSGTVSVWHVPVSSGGGATVEPAPTPTTVEPSDQPAQTPQHWPGWVTTVLRVVGITLLAALALLALSTLRFVRLPTMRWWSAVRHRAVEGAALPEVDEPNVTLDVAAARAALAGDTPRNAIVACWMQLERDAADAGLPRMPSETPTEYAERVIGIASIDPRPIEELASLYREARFSRHELLDTHRQRAASALERVVAALPSQVEVTA